MRRAGCRSTRPSRRTLREARRVKVDLYIETLDPNRFAGNCRRSGRARICETSTPTRRIAVRRRRLRRALAFLLDSRDPLFPGVPIAAVLTRSPQSGTERRGGHLVGRPRSASRLALALKLHPRTRQIALIDGVVQSAGGDAVHEEALSQIEAVGAGRSRSSPCRNLPLDELLSRVQALPPDTVIIITRQLIGRARCSRSASADAVSEVSHGRPAAGLCWHRPDDRLRRRRRRRHQHRE